MMEWPRLPLSTLRPPLAWNGLSAVVSTLASPLTFGDGSRCTEPSGPSFASTV